MHGTFKGDPPRRIPRRGRGAGLPLVFRILLREAASGSVLFAILGEDPRINLLCCAAVWAGLVLLTRRSGLLDRRDGTGLFIECFVIFCGALVFRNLLVLLPMLLAGRH